MRSISILVALSFCLAHGSAEGIIRRHDRDISIYVKTGEKYAKVVGYLGSRVACTLIAPQWALGAGHTMEEYFSPGELPYVIFDGRTYYIDKVIIHPKRVLGAVDSSSDLVLLHLTQPVHGVTPVTLYDRDDEPGQIVTLVGRGQSGTGDEGKCDGENRGTLLGAENRVEAVFENSLVISFDVPPAGLDNEGISGSGDSGCPALIERDGKVYILGVGCFNSGDVEAGTACGYGTLDGFARVSTLKPWIEQTMDTSVASTIPLYYPIVQTAMVSELPSTPAAAAAGALLNAFNSGTAEKMTEFYKNFGRRRSDEEIAVSVGQWMGLIEEYGKYELRGYAEAGPNDISLFVWATKPGIGRAVAVRVDPAKENRVTAMKMADSDIPKER